MWWSERYFSKSHVQISNDMFLHLLALIMNSSVKPTIRLGEIFLINFCRVVFVVEEAKMKIHFQLKSFTWNTKPAHQLRANECWKTHNMNSQFVSIPICSCMQDEAPLQRASLKATAEMFSMIDWKANLPRLHFSFDSLSTLVSWIIDAPLWYFAYNLFIIRVK